METLSLAGDGIDPALLPAEELADCAAAVLAGDGRTILSYGTGAGYTPLRELIGEWFGVHPFRVVLTNGWLQGFGLLVGAHVQRKRVAAEYPIHDRAQQLLLGAGATMVPISIYPDGLDTDEFATYTGSYGVPDFLYTMPTFQNPTGYSMTLERRQHLLDVLRHAHRLSDRIRTVVVENDSYGLTRVEGERLPTLFDLSGKETVYSASFSPILAPGLRVAWFVVSEEQSRTLATDANDTYIAPVLLAQAIVFDYLRRGGLEQQLNRVREGLKLRRDTMDAALDRHLGDASWSHPEGGLYLWVTLPPGTDGRVILADAGVEAVSGAALGALANTMRLSFGAVGPETIEEAVALLGAAYDRSRS